MDGLPLGPGFRFRPTDVELVMYYLKRKILGKRFYRAIDEVDIYKFSPEELPGKSCIKSNDQEWYFFCRPDFKYSNGSKTNRTFKYSNGSKTNRTFKYSNGSKTNRRKRTTINGYWKATGNDRKISHHSRTVGKKKTLIFYYRKAQDGRRTDWVIHEYRLEDSLWNYSGIHQETFVLCKLYKKSGPGPRIREDHVPSFEDEEWEYDIIDRIPDELEPLGSDMQVTHLPPDENSLPQYNDPDAPDNSSSSSTGGPAAAPSVVTHLPPDENSLPQYNDPDAPDNSSSSSTGGPAAASSVVPQQQSMSETLSNANELGKTLLNCDVNEQMFHVESNGDIDWPFMEEAQSDWELFSFLSNSIHPTKNEGNLLELVSAVPSVGLASCTFNQLGCPSWQPASTILYPSGSFGDE